MQAASPTEGYARYLALLHEGERQALASWNELCDRGDDDFLAPMLDGG